MARLDVLVELVDGRTIIESHVGVAVDVKTAKQQAYASFLVGSFHVILSALLNHKCEQVENNTIVIGGKNWNIFDSGAQIKSSVQVDNKKLLDWHEKFENGIRESPLSPGVHWLRLYVAQMNNKIVSLECLLDNDDCEQGLRWMNEHQWYKTDGFYSVRMFVIIFLRMA